MKLDEAEMELRKSIELQPTYYAYSNLSLVYYEQKGWARAAEMLEAALRLNRSDFRVWANLGMAYEWLNQPEKAANAYREESARLEEVFKIKPDEAAIQCERGLLYARQGLRTKAMSMIEMALARTPEDAELLLCVAEVYETMGNRSQALVEIQRAVQKGTSRSDLEHNPGLRSLLLDPAFRTQGEVAAQP